MNKKVDIASLSASYLAGEMNSKETQLFLNLIEDDKDKKNEFLKMKDTWEKISSDPLTDYTETTSAWNNLYKRMDEEGLVEENKTIISRISPTFIRIAASILLILAVSVSLYFYINSDRQIIDHGINYVATNGNAAYDLPDGSRVFLKKGSLLELSGSFEQQRTVELKGEAFFDIMSDPSSPFIISTDNATITVLGTSFNVKEDKSKSITEVYVESGKVKVKSSGENNEIILNPGEYSKIDRKAARIEKLSDPNYLAWKTRMFRFEDVMIDQVFEILENAYQVKIVVKDKEIENLRITTTYNKQSIDAILSTIGTAFNLEVEKKKDSYQVSLRK